MGMSINHLQLAPRLVVLFLLIVLPNATAVERGEIDLTVLDAKTKDPIPARLRIFDARGRAPRIRNVPRLGNDFSFSNLLSFKLKTGKYQFTIDRGPHYQQRAGYLEVNRDGFDQKTVTLPRFVDMRSEGYFSGDLLVARDRDVLPLLMNVEELDYAATASWSPGVELSKLAVRRDRNIQFGPANDTELSPVIIQDFSAAVLDTKAGRYLAANLQEPPEPTDCPKEPKDFALATGKAGEAAFIALDPWAWDLPMLVAHDLVDAIAVYGDMLRSDGDQSKIKFGRPPSDGTASQRHAAGRYAERIYFHLLNCGLRIPPVAFSNSGETNAPPGFNRVYVACGQDFSVSSWWKNLLKGQSVISNGPVLRVRVNERLPGTVFRGQQPLELEITCDLATRQKIEYLEIIKNGQILDSIRLSKWAEAGGHLPLVTFKQSGWLTVRAHAPREENFRCAMSAPFYIEIDERPRIQKSSAKFFKDWVYERAQQIKASKLPPEQKRKRLLEQKSAFDFWSDLENRADSAISN